MKEQFAMILQGHTPSHKYKQVFEKQARLPWLIWGNGDGEEGGEDLGRQKFTLIGEFHPQQRFLSFYFT